jgi:hypothetical protein
MCEYRQEHAYSLCFCCYMLIMMFVHNPLKEYECTKQTYIYNVSYSSSMFFSLYKD